MVSFSALLLVLLGLGPSRCSSVGGQARGTLQQPVGLGSALVLDTGVADVSLRPPISARERAAAAERNARDEANERSRLAAGRFLRGTSAKWRGEAREARESAERAIRDWPNREGGAFMARYKGCPKKGNFAFTGPFVSSVRYPARTGAHPRPAPLLLGEVCEGGTGTGDAEGWREACTEGGGEWIDVDVGCDAGQPCYPYICRPPALEIEPHGPTPDLPWDPVAARRGKEFLDPPFVVGLGRPLEPRGDGPRRPFVATKLTEFTPRPLSGWLGDNPAPSSAGQGGDHQPLPLRAFGNMPAV